MQNYSKSKLRVLALAVLGGASLASVWTWGVAAERPATELLAQREAPQPLKRVPIAGNPETLRYRYEKWKSQRTLPDHVLVFRLAPSRYLSKHETDRVGFARLDLAEGKLRIKVGGDGNVPFDVWLDGTAPIHGRPGDRARSARLLGRVAKKGIFDIAAAEDFRFDQVVLTSPGGNPDDGAALFGIPSLYERLLVEERGRDSSARGGVVIEGPGGGSGGGSTLEDYVRLGEDLFRYETFNGNGRTCSTCHRPENNHTIDPDYIDYLRQEHPDDKLFVAGPEEDDNQQPNPLNSDQNGSKRFEVEELLNKGLILVNADGFDDLQNKYVVRAVPHLLGIGLSIHPAPDANPAYEDSLGWDGEGAPLGTFFLGNGTTVVNATGSLRDFAVGAIIQHFPRTLDRTRGNCSAPSADFCLPTALQLNYLEAFLLSLGRREDTLIHPPSFRDTEVELGADEFTRPYGCRNCHFEGGAIEVEQNSNKNFKLGVEDFLHCNNRPPNALPSSHKHDAGRGSNPYEDQEGGCLPGVFSCQFDCERADSFGDLTFNTPSIVEAADTLPHFHNNATLSVWESIEFYNSEEFLLNGNGALTGDGSGGLGGCFDSNGQVKDSCEINPENIARLEKFLAVLNTIDNFDSQAAPPVERALLVAQTPEYDNNDIPKLLSLGLATLYDVKMVLETTPPGTDDYVARDRVQEAINSLEWVLRPENSNQASVMSRIRMNIALTKMCQARYDLVDEPCPWNE